MGSCGPAAAALVAAGKRLFSSASAQPPILVACALERLPVVMPEPPEWETEYKEWSAQRRIDMSFFKEYPEKALRSRQASASSQQLSEEEEESKRQFNPVPRIMKADATGDKKTMKRRLDQKLVLLLKREDLWTFPFLLHTAGQSVRETAQQALKWYLADPAPAFFIGNAPMAHYKSAGGMMFFMSAQVQHDPWPVRLKKEAKVADFAWVTKDELGEYITDPELLHLAQQML